MKKQYSIGFLALAGLLVAGVPAYAQTDTTASVETTAVTAVSVTGEKVEVEIEDEDDDASEERLTPREEKERMERERKARAEGVREEMKTREEIRFKGGEEGIALREEIRHRIEVELEDDAEHATTLAELRMKREERRAELEDEEASTTPKFRETMKNANEVRLAVHSLLASEELVGGIGPRISEIAKRMNDAVGTTTNAEAQIESRGFFKKLFFGGDETAAEAIKEVVGKNQENIAELKTLLADGAITEEVKAELTEQMEVLEKAQERLTNVAEKEGKRWGFFSWRLFSK